jgi:hypothetical protein
VTRCDVCARRADRSLAAGVLSEVRVELSLLDSAASQNLYVRQSLLRNKTFNSALRNVQVPSRIVVCQTIRHDLRLARIS